MTEAEVMRRALHFKVSAVMGGDPVILDRYQI